VAGTFWLSMTQAGVLGFLINLAYFALIKHGSPLTTHIANCAKSAMQTGLGVLLFGNRVTGPCGVWGVWGVCGVCGVGFTVFKELLFGNRVTGMCVFSLPLVYIIPLL